MNIFVLKNKGIEILIMLYDLDLIYIYILGNNFDLNGSKFKKNV